MSRTSVLTLLVVVTVLTPFSGLPVAIRTLLAVICGVCVFGIGLSLRTHGVSNSASSVAPPPIEPPPSTSPSGVSPI